MVNQSDEPLRKVTLNLFESDLKWFEEHYPKGSVADTIRQAIRNYIEIQREWQADEQ